MPEPSDAFDSLTSSDSRAHQTIKRGGVFFRTAFDGEVGSIQASDASGVLWSDDGSDQRTESEHNVPRRISTLFTRHVWANLDASVVASLVEDRLGVRIDAWHGGTGTRLWSRHIPLPPPAPFADPNPPGDDNAEDLKAFLATDPSALVLGIQRNTRTTTSEDFLPDFQCRLDLIGFDAQTGSTRWETQHDNVYVQIADDAYFDGLHRRAQSFCAIDWETGLHRELLLLKRGRPGWPRRIGDNVICAHLHKDTLTIDVVDFKTATLRSSASIEVGKRRLIEVYVSQGRAIINLDSYFYVPLSRDLRPLTVLRTTGWYRDFQVGSDGELNLTTTMKTFTLDPETGQVLHSRP